MVRKITIISVFLFLLPLLAYADGEIFWETKLPFEKAAIKYVISGIENGEETLYLKNFGNTTAKYRRSSMQVMGIEKITETIELINPEWIYMYDLQTKTGTKVVNTKKYLAEEYLKLSDSEKERVRKNSQELSMGFLFGGLNGVLQENAKTMLGMVCDKMQFMGTTIYAIHDSDIPLETESNIMGMMTLVEAVSVQEGFAPEKYFLHPSGIIPVADLEADAISRARAQEAILKLNDPEFSKKAFSHGRSYLPEPNPDEQQEMEQAVEALKNIFEK